MGTQHVQAAGGTVSLFQVAAPLDTLGVPLQSCDSFPVPLSLQLGSRREEVVVSKALAGSACSVPAELSVQGQKRRPQGSRPQDQIRARWAVGIQGTLQGALPCHPGGPCCEVPVGPRPDSGHWQTLITLPLVKPKVQDCAGKAQRFHTIIAVQELWEV